MSKTKKLDTTNRHQLVYFETLKLIQEGLSVSEIAKHRHVVRSSVYGVLKTMIKRNLIKRIGWGDYQITKEGYKKHNIEKKEVAIETIKPKKIVKVKTTLEFNGDIRQLKDFLLKNKDSFINPALKEKKRDIPLKIRREVFKRSNNLCVICGEEGKEIDHIIPFCVGGKHTLRNLRLLCLQCHRNTFSEIGKVDINVSNNNEREIICKL